jgi:hypothetical protein
MKFSEVDHLEEILEHLLHKLQDVRQVLTTAELIEMIKQSDAYQKYHDRLHVSNNFDISPVVGQPHFNENYDLINEHKPLYSLLRSAKRLEQNKFGHWGINEWPEVTPKTINHKIYLVIKHHGKPMHFREIADRINEISFDAKTANAATVHNELILDKQYVLIGRGIYALKEWGYREGTVADVVSEVMREAQTPLTKDEIMERVLQKRMVKRATINLALMDRDHFFKNAGRYSLGTTQN